MSTNGEHTLRVVNFDLAQHFDAIQKLWVQSVRAGDMVGDELRSLLQRNWTDVQHKDFIGWVAEVVDAAGRVVDVAGFLGALPFDRQREANGEGKTLYLRAALTHPRYRRSLQVMDNVQAEMYLFAVAVGVTRWVYDIATFNARSLGRSEKSIRTSARETSTSNLVRARVVGTYSDRPGAAEPQYRLYSVELGAALAKVTLTLTLTLTLALTLTLTTNRLGLDPGGAGEG